MNDSPWCSVRFSVAYALFAVTFADHFKRFSISLIVIAMSKSEQEANNTMNINANSTTEDHEVPTYDWNGTARANIIAAYFYGYTVSIVLSGQLINRIGARKGIGISNFCSAILQFLFPWAASVGYHFFVALRVLDGLITGFLFVGTCYMIGSWGLPHERGKLSTISQSATWVGIMAGFFVAGLICGSDVGWPFAFYTSGILILIAVVIWYFVGFNSPYEHPRISKTERSYMRRASLSVQKFDKKENEEFITSIEQFEKEKQEPVPWKKIIKNKAVIGLAIFHCLYNWGYYYILTTFPQYLNDVHSMDISENGLLNCLPYVFGLFGTLTTGHVLDVIIAKKIMTITKTKKLFLSIYAIVLSLCFVIIGIWGENFLLAIVMLCISGTILGVGLVTFISNFADISPSYSGEISSITNGLGCLPGFLAPLVNSAFTRHNSTQQEWMYSYLLTSGITIIACISYLCLGSGKVQSFDKKFYVGIVSGEEKIVRA